MKMPSEPILPPALQPGDRMAVVAPAGACRAKDLEPGLAILRGFGLVPVLSDVLLERQRYLAGGDEQRAAALMKAFVDPSVAGIVCARGGYGAMRILPHLDFAIITAHPKRLVGFSDISALLSAVGARAGLVCFHGPTLASLAAADGVTRTGLKRMLCDRPALNLSLRQGRVLVEGIAEGRLCGGNLTTLCHLVGTPFAPGFAGGILVLEDRGEAPYRIDRMLTQLRLAGVLEGVRAVVLGDFSDCGPVRGLRPVFEDRLGDLGVPVISGLKAGHGQRNFTLPLGLTARLDTGQKTLKVMELPID